MAVNKISLKIYPLLQICLKNVNKSQVNANFFYLCLEVSGLFTSNAKGNSKEALNSSETDSRQMNGITYIAQIYTIMNRLSPCLVSDKTA